MAIYHELSRAQQGVAELLLKGMTNREIADKLCVCEKTIKFHVTSILKIVGCDSRHRFIARHYLQVISALEKIHGITPHVPPPLPEKKPMKKDDGVPELPR